MTEKKLRRKNPGKDPRILTIAGSDPSGGAGIQADLRVFQRFGWSARSVITAVTAQNETKFFSVNPVSPKVLRDQLRGVGRCDYVKIGMLGTRGNVGEVLRYVKSAKPKAVVLDPVLRSSTGTTLLGGEAVPLLKRLFRSCTLVTPNLDEASILSGIDVETIADMKTAAKIIHKNSPGLSAVLVKGGHLTGEGKDRATDILYDGKEFYDFTVAKLPKSFHGTGCALSSSLVAYLALGNSLRQATAKSKKDLFFLLKQAAFGKRRK